MGIVTFFPAQALAAISENLRFFTRLPIGESAQAPDFDRIGWAAPVAGAIVGGFGAAVILVSRKLELPGVVGATLAVAVEVLVTGGLHEDGLADVCDGFGGGRDPVAKLAIMRDSQIGVYGTIAIILVLLLRIEAISALSLPFASFASAAVIFAAAAARAAALAPLAWAPPARIDGTGASVGRLKQASLFCSAFTLFCIATALAVLWLQLVHTFFACVIGALVVWLIVFLAKRQIGGQTGDVCGTSAALVEVVILLTLLIGEHEH
jgi:adenosylcobinamide-GDP ribazoletransferase